MSDQFENFRAMCAGDATMAKEWTATTNRLIAEAAQIGVEVTPADLLKLSCVRLSVAAKDASLAENWTTEAEAKIPAFQKRLEARRIAEALRSDDHAKKADAETTVAAMNPGERMKFARQSGASLPGPVTTKRDLNESEKIAALRQLEHLRGSAKIQRARELGLE